MAQKTVFISYRRNLSRHFARLLFHQLRELGYDVFFDYEGLDNGIFERVILSEIGRRAHFLLLIGQGTLNGCQKPGDWVRREYEEAVRLKRNIVPVLDELEMGQITGVNLLPGLSARQSIRYLADYHQAFLTKLCDRFLQEPRFVEIAPESAGAPDQAQVVAQAMRKAEAAGRPSAQQLSAEELMNRGNRHFHEGRFEQARADYARAAELDPEDGCMWYNLGLACTELGQWRRAIEHYTRAIALDAEDAEAHYQRGVAFANSGQWVQAIEDYDAAIDMDKGYGEAIRDRASAYCQLAIWDLALRDARQAVRLLPEDADAYNNRGYAYENSGKVEKAREDYRRALELEPGHVLARENLEAL